MINWKPVGRVLGLLLCLLGLLMWTAIPVAYLTDGRDMQHVFNSGLIAIAIGLPIFVLLKPREDEDDIKKREGYLIVTLGWVTMTIISMLPYLLSEEIHGITDAFFECMSGLTTTGASIINDIEAVSPAILYWRSLTQWIGGMGIIVLTVALFPLLGIGGIELFVAESPGPNSNKIHPRIRETAKRLWLIYVFLTALLFVVLKLLGMSFFDAINHAFTTMATGGFSTKNSSIVFWDNMPSIQYTLAFFMFVAGTNYAVIYSALSGSFKKILKFEEFVWYVILVAICTIVISFGIAYHTDLGGEMAFRQGLFQVISLITTTGFVSADYTSWTPYITLICFVLMFVGACVGSTSGGIKILRNLVFFKNSFLEFKRLLHPRAVIPLKVSGAVVAPKVMTHILVFLLIYLMLFIMGSITVSIMGLDFESSVGAVGTCLGNVGPGIGVVGPMNNFAGLPADVKWVLCFMMLAGRLELFSVLIIFTPYFWKSN